MDINYTQIWQSLLFLVVCLALFFIGKLIFQLFNKKINVNIELTDKDNLSFFFIYIGYFFGILAAIGGIMSSPETAEFKYELLYVLIYGLVSIIVLNLVAKVLDYFFISDEYCRTEVVDKFTNSIGIYKAGQFVSIGIVLAGVLLTEIEKPLELIVFLGASVVLLTLGSFYYTLITPFEDVKEIKNGNSAVAISYVGAQISIAILIFAVFQTMFLSWEESIKWAALDLGIGLVLLPIVRIIIDNIFLPNHKLTNELVNQEKPNVGAGMLEAFAYIGTSILVIWCIY